MQEGNVVLTSLMQADGQAKLRPAIVLRHMRPYGDLLVCGLSSQMQQGVAGFDEVIARGDDDFAESGLTTDSLIRLGFLLTVPRKMVSGTIGRISDERYDRLIQRLCDYLNPIIRTQ
jgi:mRNA interferase MazF